MADYVDPGILVKQGKPDTVLRCWAIRCKPCHDVDKKIMVKLTDGSVHSCDVAFEDCESNPQTAEEAIAAFNSPEVRMRLMRSMPSFVVATSCLGEVAKVYGLWGLKSCVDQNEVCE